MTQKEKLENLKSELEEKNSKKPKFISTKALLISLGVIALIAVIPWVHSLIMEEHSGYDPDVYTARAVNFETGQIISVGNYRHLLEGFIESFGPGYALGGNWDFDREIVYAPFISMSVEDFIIDTQRNLLQTQLLSKVVQWKELDQILGGGLEIPRTYEEFLNQLTQMGHELHNDSNYEESWEVPRDIIFSEPRELDYHAKVGHRMVSNAEDTMRLGDLIFLHRFGGVQELSEWAFSRETIVGNSAIIDTFIGRHEVYLYGFVSPETVESYLNSQSIVRDTRVGQYHEKLRNWSLISQ